MATLAIAGSKCGTGFGVIRVGGVLPILQMAEIALRGKSKEDADSGTAVTRVARNRSVSPEQRKTILVILHLLRSEIPALYRVTLFAVRTHLTTMNIGVTIGAILSDVGENRFGVTVNALHFFVQSAKWILRLVVIELWDCADGSPACGGVTVFARNR
jgi:hypothetical protein